MRLNRDSVWWGVSIIGSIAIALSTRFDAFSWIPPGWRNAIELTAFIYPVVAGKLASSPLPPKRNRDFDDD